MSSLYSIQAKQIVKPLKQWTDDDKLFNALYEKLMTEDYKGTFPFDNKPSQQECLELIQYLRPNRKYFLDSITIEYFREQHEKEK